MNKKICIVYTHHKLGDLIWQLPYIKAISEHYDEKLDLIVREKTQAKNIFKDLKYLDYIHYNNFRKGFAYWIDVFKLTKIFIKKKYDYVYILDKVNKPAIAARLAGIKNVIGPGIGNQKKWLTNKKFLNNEDWEMNYSDQSKKLLNLQSIQIKDYFPKIEINTSRLEKDNLDLLIQGKKIAFGVDSFEDYKMWYEENFIELAHLFYKKRIFDFIYLICGPDKSYIAENIIKNSKQNYFIDCSKKDLQGIILAIKNSSFYVGNNSGPLNLSAALDVKTFGLIANDPISELKNSNINPITPNEYVDNVWNRNREGMKKLKTIDVYNYILENLKI